MSTFEEVFERIKRATNTRTQVELAEVLDIRQSSISDAKRRNSIPSDWYMKLFEKFGLNPDWLKLETGPMYLKSDHGYEPYDAPDAVGVADKAAHYANPDSKGATVTVYSMQCEAGEDGAWTPKVEGKLNVPQSYAKGSLKVLKVDASSMEPIIHRNAFVGIDTDQTGVASGELYGVFVPYEGLAIRRVFLDAENGRYILRAENPSHPEQYLPVEKREERIFGRAVWVLQSF